MTRQDLHSALVTEWMEKIVRPLTPSRMVQTLEDTFAAMWRRAYLTLGEVTLSAIVDRILYNAKERFPILSSCKVEPSGLGTGDLRGRADSLPRDQLWGAMQFVLVEFLTVLGNLTAEILTPAMHATLTATDGKSHNVQRNGEDAKS